MHPKTIVLLVAALVANVPVHSANLNGSYSFSVPNTVSPNPVTGTFRINFDTGASSTECQYTGISLTSSNFALDYDLGFFYNATSDFLVVGGGIPGADIASGNTCLGVPDFTNDFALQILGISTDSPFLSDRGSMIFATSSLPVEFLRGGSVKFTPQLTPVPEPSSLALLGLGLASLGLSRRRKAA